MSKHIIVLGSYAESLVNFRGDFIKSLVKNGCRVTAMAPDATALQIEAINKLGAQYASFTLQRNGMSIRWDWASYAELRRIFLVLKPDILFAYTIKPVIWGGLALQSCPKAMFFPLITGLGFAFSGTSLRRRLLKVLVVFLYRLSLRRAKYVFFQNSDNRDQFVLRGIATLDRAVIVAGSGVNTDRFAVQPLPKLPVVFLMIARLLAEKGTREYVAAAKRVREQYPSVTFRLAGPLDPSPDGIQETEVDSWIREGAMEYLGELRDVRSALARCHIYVLPSYHEGIPRTVLEAMATGRGIITTHAPGCKETVQVGENGFLAVPGDVDSLVDQLLKVIRNTDQLQQLGVASRRLVEERFCVHKVNKVMLEHILGDSA